MGETREDPIFTKYRVLFECEKIGAGIGNIWQARTFRNRFIEATIFYLLQKFDLNLLLCCS
jgi:hypothetical protein